MSATVPYALRSDAAAVRFVRRAQVSLDAALAARDAAIRDARAHTNVTLRELADVTGLSVEWVRRIAAGTASRS